MRLGAVYKVSLGDKFIIGSSLNPHKRKNDYRNRLKNNKWNNEYVQKVYNSHPNTYLKFEILQNDIPEEILEHVEDIWIGILCGRAEDDKGGMNVRDAFRVRFTKEIRNKISSKNKGRKLNNEQKLRIKKGLTGLKRSEETKKKLSKAKSLKVYQYDLEGNFIREWESTIEAAISINGYDELICKCCLGKRKMHKGYLWSRDFLGDKIPPYKRTNSLKKSIKQIDKNGEVIKKWESLSSVNKDLGWSIGDISNCLNGKRDFSYGFKWEFA